VRELEAMVNGARTEAWRRQAIRDKAIVYLLLYAGLRVSELCALEMSDIDLAPRSGQVLVRSGKGGKARAVPLNLDARRAVSDWQNVRGDYPTPIRIKLRLENRMARGMLPFGF
jgi:site-specific recombinase XerC